MWVRVLSICVALFISSGNAIGKSQLQLDQENFKSLFQDLGGVPGYGLDLCGMKSKRDEFVKSLEFIAAGYRKLNKKFPEYAPLGPQVIARNDAIFSVQQYGNKQPDLSECDGVIKYDVPRLTRDFEKSVTELKVRLAKAGYDYSNLNNKDRNLASSSDSCEMKAQYYQDRYQSGGRVNDLICMKKALERELR